MLNITVLPLARLRQGAMPVYPTLSDQASAQVVASGAASTVLIGPCVVCLIADEDQRIGVARVGGYVAPAASGIKLKAGVERYRELPAGAWFISVLADSSTGAPLPVGQAGTVLSDATIASLSAGQAAGTAAVIAANPARRVFAITPPADAQLRFVKGDGSVSGFFWPLYAGVARTIDAGCPTNALVVSGLGAGVVLPMAEG